jgi:hypothetical protein
MEDLDVVGISVAFTLAEVFLDFSFQFFSATLDVLAAVVGSVAEVTTKLSFHLLAGPFDLVLETSFVEICHFFLRFSQVLAGLVNASDMPS